ncbi:hypothetical protein LCGC14_1227130 [marine sediment metagenome]|uniref:Uncharacterized protein n=1 Tax=marine sediment metagenome TaxID=412755 RepID=A0A0F9NRU9_9ZZZZ
MSRNRIEAEGLLLRVRAALTFYANRRNWRDDDWGILSVIGGKAYGKPTEKAARAKRAIDAYFKVQP